MTFDHILSQVLELLQRQGRVSYRALKRRFDLDDDYIEDLKEELLFAYPVVDEEGRGFVWTGEAERPPVSTSTPPALQEVTPAIQSTQAAPPREAERRQLTVMFCDLVDSTRLSSQLDPEDYREVVRAYQKACAEVIQRYDGHIAQHLGDGLLVYFGYPQAHEDDAQRAIHSGLGIVEAIGKLTTNLEPAKGIKLAVRLGIHTGLVVVGEMGGAGRQEQLALGEVPNIAARIQGLAEPNTVLISADTYRLIQGYFACQELGEQTLRGVEQPIAVYRVLKESGVQSRLEVATARGLTPLVGREQAVGLLLERWHQVKEGQGQVILLSGEGGIGKSRLVQVLKEHIANEPHMWWECRSSPYSQNTALYPITDFFQRALQWQQDEMPEVKLTKLEQALRQYRLPVAETVPLFAPFLSLTLPEDRYPPLMLSPQRQRQKTLETIVAFLLELAERQSVLFILEDLHWTDPSTLELLDLLIDHTPAASLCLLLTCRQTFQPAWHHRSYLTEVTVNRLSREQITRMAGHVAGGKPLPHQVLEQIIEKTDGVPLFVEEMTKALLESGHLQEVNGHYELTGTLPALAIPATLQDSLMARLDRLVTAKAVAQYAAVIGRQFSYELLHAVSQLDEVILQHELGRLVEAELLYQRGLPPQATYLFKHALIRDAAYETLLKSTRQQYHQHIAQVLAVQFPDTVETQPELLAHHSTEAGLIAQAIPYWHQAGQRAAQRSAHAEAISHLTNALELLKTLPDTPERAQQELALQITLGPALSATKSWAAPEVERAYARARELCQQIGETPQLFTVLRGLWVFYFIRAEYQTAQELGERCLTLAQSLQDPSFLLEAHHALWDTLVWLGEVVSARAHMEQGAALYDPQKHRSHALLYEEDPEVCRLAVEALALWYLGYPDQALGSIHNALTLAREISHPYSLAMALSLAVWVHQCRRETQLTQERAEAFITLSTTEGFPFWAAWGTIVRGWGLTEQGQGEEGVAQIRRGLPMYRATGAEAFQPYFLALLAEVYGKVGQGQEGLTALAEALAMADRTGERLHVAELYRLKGTLTLQSSIQNPQSKITTLPSLTPNPQAEAEAEECFWKAIEIARQQQAKSLELRTAMSLSRLWQQQGKRAEAYNLLAPIYSWFTEGFDTVDLQEAKALLTALT
jgi:class 3 adenylate cyclase/predicted ATPase